MTSPAFTSDTTPVSLPEVIVRVKGSPLAGAGLVSVTGMEKVPSSSSSTVPVFAPAAKPAVLSLAGIVKVRSSLSGSMVQMSLVSPSVRVMVTTSASSARASSSIMIAERETVLPPPMVKVPLPVEFCTSATSSPSVSVIIQPKGMSMSGVALAITSKPCTFPLSLTGSVAVPVKPIVVVSLSSMVTTCVVLPLTSHPSGKESEFSLNVIVTVSSSSMRVSSPGTSSMEIAPSPSGRSKIPVLSVYPVPLME